MKLYKIYLVFSMIIMMGQVAKAQLKVTLILPPPSPSITDIIDNPNLFRAIITNTGNEPIRFKTRGLLKLDGSQVGLLPKDKSQIYEIAAFSTNTYNLNDIFSLEADLEYDQSFIQTILRTGYSPAGLYEWCFEMYDADDPEENIVMPLTCRSQYISAIQPPTILYPNDEAIIVKNKLPIMRWTHVSLTHTKSAVRYEVKVFKTLNGQTPMQAFRTNQPYFERSTMAVQLLWPVEVPMENGLYIWTVQAFNSENVVLGNPEKYAEPQTFRIPKGVDIDNNVPLTAGAAVLMQFSPKTDPNEIEYEMIIGLKDIDAVKRIFELSDQYTTYDLSLKAQMKLSPTAKNIALPLYNAWGDVVAVYTAEGNVLSFKNEPKNNKDIGWDGTLGSQQIIKTSVKAGLPTQQMLSID